MSEIDGDIIKSMTSLGCFKDKTALIRALMQPGCVCVCVCVCACACVRACVHECVCVCVRA